jgi:hypothetical protein
LYICKTVRLLNVMRGSLQVHPEPPANRDEVSVNVCIFRAKYECITAVHSGCRKERFICICLLVVLAFQAIRWAGGAWLGVAGRI